MDRVDVQEIEGIGFSNAFYTNWWHRHEAKEEIYDLLLSVLRPSIVRLRNLWDQKEGDEYVTIDKEFMQAARKRLAQDKPRVMLCAWSPPRRLKSNGKLLLDTGGGAPPRGTLAQAGGEFQYDAWADWWVDSLHAYAAADTDSGIIRPDWISHQNEPDYEGAGHQAMLMSEREDRSGGRREDRAGYYEAGEVLHKRLKKEFGSYAPKMIGPESFGIDGYLDSMGQYGNTYHAVANHLYSNQDMNDPTKFGGMVVKAQKQTGQKEMYMSEYAKVDHKHQWHDPLHLAITMHMSLAVGKVTSYMHWDGAWARDLGRYVDDGEKPTEEKKEQDGTLILVDDPFSGSKHLWRTKRGFDVLHSFHWFRHFSAYIRPGYKQVRVDLSLPASSAYVSAWNGSNGQMTIIMINPNGFEVELKLSGLPEYMQRQNRDLNYSTLDEEFTSLGRFDYTPLTLKPFSIYSIHSY